MPHTAVSHNARHSLTKYSLAKYSLTKYSLAKYSFAEYNSDAANTSPAKFNRFSMVAMTVVLVLISMALTALPASADWVVTHRGDRLETDGPWKIEDDWVVYQDLQGSRRAVHKSAVDLEASRQLTADPDAEIKTREPESEGEAEAKKDPAVVMYATSWCGYCRKTRQLLDEIGADYVEKDIEKSAEARSEYQKKTRGQGGVPVLDIGGEIIRGYQPDVIRQRIAQLPPKAAADQP